MACFFPGIREKLSDNEFTCPYCGEEDMLFDDLEPDYQMRKKVQAFKNRKSAVVVEKELSPEPEPEPEPVVMHSHRVSVRSPLCSWFCAFH